MKRFYFTTHPGDLMRSRLPKGCAVMLVASAHWDEKRRRFKIRRPPAGHVGHVCIDSGGFNAARRWGTYPWSLEEYVDFCLAIGEEADLDFVACMDYACEPGVERSVHATNKARIDATHQNELEALERFPALPWLPVIQGDTIAEREYDLARRQALGIAPKTYAGIGSICGRSIPSAARTVLFLASQLPGVSFHGFGMNVRVLDNEAAWPHVRSWDSYAWTWPRGQLGVDRPEEYVQRPGETSSKYRGRIAQLYYKNTIAPRLAPPSNQLSLLG